MVNDIAQMSGRAAVGIQSANGKMHNRLKVGSQTFSNTHAYPIKHHLFFALSPVLLHVFIGSFRNGRFLYGFAGAAFLFCIDVVHQRILYT